MNVAQAINSAKAFDLAADRCSESRPLGENQFQMLAVPAIVCRAFAAEVGLKALILDAGRTAHGHDLAALFRQLPENLQGSLIATVRLSQNQFHAELDGIAQAFVEWRYVFETDTAINLNFLSNFAQAIIGALPSGDNA